MWIVNVTEDNQKKEEENYIQGNHVDINILATAWKW